MKKVLIISYYWPPSGGAGVQRWVKLAKYLTRLGYLPYIITVDEKNASYMQWDESLIKDVEENIKVFKTKSFEPINWYAKIAGKKNVPTAGFSNVNNRSVIQKLVNSLRSNLFIPDPRRGWNRFAFSKAKEIILKENIKTVITTSPPHSSQLIGYKLKQQLNIHWIADLRDPWTDIYYYPILGHSWLSNYINKKYERKVLEKSDRIITVSKGLKTLFCSKSELIKSDKIAIIPNGFDDDDFVKRSVENPSVFTISYTGTMSEEYNPYVFFDAIKKCTIPIKIRIVGKIADSILQYAIRLGLEKQLEIISYVPHQESVDFLLRSSALLLIIPDVSNSEGILTGKMFEYLASQKPIICIGPKQGDAATIINDCNSGITFNRMETEKITDYINQLILGKKISISEEKCKLYSRMNQAKMITEFII